MPWPIAYRRLHSRPTLGDMEVDGLKPRLDDRSPDDWLAKAAKFRQMARRFRHNSELSKTFHVLAADACHRAGNPLTRCPQRVEAEIRHSQLGNSQPGR